VTTGGGTTTLQNGTFNQNNLQVSSIFLIQAEDRSNLG
jgi:hypothetical protein